MASLTLTFLGAKDGIVQVLMEQECAIAGNAHQMIAEINVGERLRLFVEREEETDAKRVNERQRLRDNGWRRHNVSGSGD